MINGTCPTCGAPFTSRRSNAIHCSDRCRRRTAKSRARLNGAQWTKAPPSMTRECAWCGVEFNRKPTGSKPKYGWFCSMDCKRALWKNHEAPSPSRELAPFTADRSRTAKRPRPSRKFYCGYCPICGNSYITSHNDRTCGKSDCRNEMLRVAKRNRRALERQAFVETVIPQQVYERDGWQCWLCHEPLDRHADKNANRAPSIDHVIPLSLGGTHEPSNVRAAHRQCNAARGNRVAFTHC